MNFSLIEISKHDYLVLGKLLTERFGIKLPPEKQIMFQARLQSRLRELKMNSFDLYREFILDPANTNAEMEEMIGYISTNKTEFFREQQHFNVLHDRIFPDMLDSGQLENEAFLNCWSAGCSKGQEAFTLAMVIDWFRQEQLVDFDFNILGTDVSKKVLEVACNGIYPYREIRQIPDGYLKKYVLRSKDQTQLKIKIVRSLRNQVQFRYGNLMDSDYQMNNPFQIIFLRNTLIYFSLEDQTAILKKVLKYLMTGGYLFIGHSESLVNRDLPLRIVAPSVYKKI